MPGTGIGTDKIISATNIGTNTAGKTVQIGDATSTAVNVNALATTITSVNALSVTDGAANLAFNGSGATTLTTVAYDHNATGAVTIDASSSNAISIGATSATGSVNLGTSGARTITVGNTTAATKIVLNSGYDLESPGEGGITTVGNIHLDASLRGSAIPSAFIVTFQNNSGGDMTAGQAAAPSGNMGCTLATDASDNIIGIVSKGNEDGEPVQVQIGGIMLAKFTGSNTAGNLATVHASNGTLEDDGVTEVGDTNRRFITVRAGSSGNNDSLVMWIKSESY
jgi:hypothetical protein